MTNHREIYRHAKYCDIAFDFKDVPRECDFIEVVFFGITDRKPGSFIELGAGPANFAIEFARRGVKSLALDISAEMAEYGRSKAREVDVPMGYLVADMISYHVHQRYNMAALMMDLASYLLDNESAYRHFGCVSDSLNSDGIYVLELTHPRDILGPSESTQSQWTAERDGARVPFRWGLEEDSFDPITQVSNVTAEIRYLDGDEEVTDALRSLSKPRVRGFPPCSPVLFESVSQC